MSSLTNFRSAASSGWPIMKRISTGPLLCCGGADCSAPVVPPKQPAKVTLSRVAAMTAAGLRIPTVDFLVIDSLVDVRARVSDQPKQDGHF